jgi:hypothetical protein
MGFGGSPSYTPPPAVPPAAAPPTLASASVVNSGASRQAEAGAAGSTIGTSAEGVASGSINRAATTLGGVK